MNLRINRKRDFINATLAYSRYQRIIMFSFFKSDPKKKLVKQYDVLLEQAMQAQRSGDIRLYSSLTAEAEKVKATLDNLEEQC